MKLPMPTATSACATARLAPAGRWRPATAPAGVVPALTCDCTWQLRNGVHQCLRWRACAPGRWGTCYETTDANGTPLCNCTCDPPPSD